MTCEDERPHTGKRTTPFDTQYLEKLILKLLYALLVLLKRGHRLLLSAVRCRSWCPLRALSQLPPGEMKRSAIVTCICKRAKGTANQESHKATHASDLLTEVVSRRNRCCRCSKCGSIAS